MAYLPHTAADTREMLAAIGAASIDELFADVPAAIQLAEPVGPGRALSEMEALRLMQRRAAENKPAAQAWLSYLGAGAYEHTIPAAVDQLINRGEFLTAYTPYQPEASQGTLQVIYEFQSMICSLTGMETANASMYDGASALAEAVLLAVRATGRHEVLLPATLHPHWREVVESYTAHLGLKLHAWGADPAAGGGVTDASAIPDAAGELAAVVIQTPNFYGYLEPVAELVAAARARGALVIAAVNPMSLAVLEPPGAWGADVCVGEAQPIGLPLHYGGPYAGFFATRKEHIRRMPGRIVGRTVDDHGRGGFVLTLQTREQHIRREKATSNICTNQGLCAAMVTLWLAMIGEGGFRQLGELNLARAAQLHAGLAALPGVEPLCDAPYFNEFTLRLPIAAGEFERRMRVRGILPGLPAVRLLPAADPRLIILCVTETKTDEDIQQTIDAARAALEQSA